MLHFGNIGTVDSGLFIRLIRVSWSANHSRSDPMHSGSPPRNGDEKGLKRLWPCETWSLQVWAVDKLPLTRWDFHRITAASGSTEDESGKTEENIQRAAAVRRKMPGWCPGSEVSPGGSHEPKWPLVTTKARRVASLTAQTLFALWPPFLESLPWVYVSSGNTIKKHKISTPSFHWRCNWQHQNMKRTSAYRNIPRSGGRDCSVAYIYSGERVCSLARRQVGNKIASCAFRASAASASPSTQLLLFCQEPLCFPEERKLFHFQPLFARECERRSCGNIRLF